MSFKPDCTSATINSLLHPHFSREGESTHYQVMKILGGQKSSPKAQGLDPCQGSVRCISLTCPGKRWNSAQGESPIQLSWKRRGRRPAWGPEELLVRQLKNTGRCRDEGGGDGRRIWKVNPSRVGESSNGVSQEVPADEMHDGYVHAKAEFPVWITPLPQSA